ncbi:unnamed protein product [Ranitomeya imitator]|uniref:ATP synthase F(1) complex subunit gamma, mitochondrial n=1 Tax=Ranitomeya imitator TaxID=111125 RepID=A0ABN9KTF6_9NEOB|nr:unnamed protein product [Ranitomeya imitator]
MRVLRCLTLPVVTMLSRSSVLIFQPQWYGAPNRDGALVMGTEHRTGTGPLSRVRDTRTGTGPCPGGQVRNMATLKDSEYPSDTERRTAGKQSGDVTAVLYGWPALTSQCGKLKARDMTRHREFTRRLKSIKNIQKITKSMKMVAAAKYAKAERELKPARVYGTGALALYEKAEIKAPEDQKKHLIIGVSSDRGLCGGIHTSVAKAIKHEISSLSGGGKEVMVVGIGDKLRGLLQSDLNSDAPAIGIVVYIAAASLNVTHGFMRNRSCQTNLISFYEEVSYRLDHGESLDVVYLDFSKAFDTVPHKRTHGNHFLLTFKEVGRKPPTFGDASVIASELLNSGYEFDQGNVVFNRFRSVISYKTEEKPFFSLDTVAHSDSITVYDDVDADVLRNYQEFTLANIIYLTLKEATASEQSARMTAMDNASKNASEIIDKLTLSFNRTRQAVITKELIEIISGAAAL